MDSVSVYEAKKLPTENIAQIQPFFSDLSPQYNDVEYYYIGFDYSVTQESEFFYNGVKYEMIATGKLDGNEYIIAHENVYNIDELSDYGYSFDSISEQKAKHVIEQREKGRIVNFKNQPIVPEMSEEEQVSLEGAPVIIESDDDAVSNSPTQRNAQEERDLTLASNATRPILENIQPLSSTSTPSTIKLYLTSSKKLINIGFDAYAKDVLPNEWYASWKSEALKAGAITIKTYAWYNATYPRKPATDYGAHLTDKWENYQHYVPNSGQKTTNAAVDAVSGIFMVNSDGKVFDAQYRAGTKDEIGTAFGGVLSQWGTQYIATNFPEYDYYTILSYYYSLSDKSSGYIQTGNY